MQSLATLYLVILPLVMAAALVEGIWQSRTRAEAYDWKSWACSLADLAGRRLLAFIPYTLAAPWLDWMYEYRLFTQSLDSVWSVLLLFVGLEFFYYWFHRASHTVRWFWTSHSVHHSPNQFNFAHGLSAGLDRPLHRHVALLHAAGAAGLHAADGADGPVPEPALPVLDPCRLDPEAGLAGIRAQHAVGPSRPSRAEPGVSRRQLRRRADRLRPPVRHLCRRARRGDVRLRPGLAAGVVAQSVGAELRPVDRSREGPRFGAVGARRAGCTCSVRRAGAPTEQASRRPSCARRTPLGPRWRKLRRP